MTGESEPSERIYFKVYKGHMPVIEQALDTDALMLGSDNPCQTCLTRLCL